MSASSTSSSPGSTYDPVLITSTTLTPPFPSRGPNVPSFPRPNSRTRLPSSLRLTYPYPLPPTAILDLAYTVRHIAHHPTPLYLLLAAVLRGVVLAFIVGCSKRWRSRGGWVAGSSGISVGAAVWMGCEGVMRRGKGGLMQVEEELDVGVQTAFLIATAGIAASEYILFLLLLRLSPAGHRTHPLALRLPPSAIQSPTAFSFTEEALPPPSPYGPRLPRGTTSHRRYPSQRTFRSVRSAHVERDGHGHGHEPSEPGPSGRVNRYRPEDDGEDDDPGHRGDRPSSDLSGSYEPHETYGSYQDHDHEEDYELDPSFSEDSNDLYHSSFDGVGVDDDADADADANSEVSASSDASSISESSIIDLPPPLRPNRIIPPSLSMNNGISLAAAAAAIDNSPVLGPLVRRSRSARFLGRSWGDRSDLSRDGGDGEGEEMEVGRAGLRREYGTFQ